MLRRNGRATGSGRRPRLPGASRRYFPEGAAHLAREGACCSQCATVTEAAPQNRGRRDFFVPTTSPKNGNNCYPQIKNAVKCLSTRLTSEFGKGFTPTNLKYMRLFYNAFPIRHSLRDESQNLKHTIPKPKIPLRRDFFFMERRRPRRRNFSATRWASHREWKAPSPSRRIAPIFSRRRCAPCTRGRVLLPVA